MLHNRSITCTFLITNLSIVWGGSSYLNNLQHLDLFNWVKIVYTKTNTRKGEPLNKPFLDGWIS